jgi:hypothetical protein
MEENYYFHFYIVIWFYTLIAKRCFFLIIIYTHVVTKTFMLSQPKIITPPLFIFIVICKSHLLLLQMISAHKFQFKNAFCLFPAGKISVHPG